MTDPEEPRASQLTLQALVDLAERTLAESVRVRTLCTYRSQWRRLLEAFGRDTPVAEIRSESLQRYVDFRLSTASPMTLRHACNALIRLREIGEKAGHHFGPELRRPEIAADRSHPSPEEVGQMLRRVDRPEHRDFLLASWALLASAADLGRLELDDIAETTLTLRDANGVERVVPIVPEFEVVLTRRLESSADALFPRAQVERAGRVTREVCGNRFGLARLPGAMDFALRSAGISPGAVHSLRRGPGCTDSEPEEEAKRMRTALSWALARAGFGLHEESASGGEAESAAELG